MPTPSNIRLYGDFSRHKSYKG